MHSSFVQTSSGMSKGSVQLVSRVRNKRQGFARLDHHRVESEAR